MQPELTRRTKTWKKFFLAGVAIELFLVVCAFFPGGWAPVVARNIFYNTHAPFLFMAQEFGGLGVLLLLLVFMVMSWVWGLILRLIVKIVVPVWSRLGSGYKKILSYLGAAGMLVGLVALMVSALPQKPRPFIPSAEVASAVDANTTFALDLYQKLKDQPGNLFFSPFSISSALAMTAAGARGQTEVEMTNTLHLGISAEQRNTAFQALMERLGMLERWNRIVLKNANAAWVQSGHPITPKFLKTARENFFGDVFLANFKAASGDAAAEINRWVSDRTAGRISKAVTPGILTPNTALALCDVIYFNGKWQHQFKKKDTKPMEFYVSTNQTVNVPMMYQHEHFKHATAEGGFLEMLEMPYVGRDLSMVILMPFRSRFSPAEDVFSLRDLETQLTPENLRTWLKELDVTGAHKTSIYVPRFNTVSSFNLVSELKAMGMVSPFTGAADFSGIDGATNLFVSDVLHQSFVKVDESGTEAAAMTIALVKTKSASGYFMVDHPFVFLIRDNATGSILFLGRIIDPTK